MAELALALSAKSKDDLTTWRIEFDVSRVKRGESTDVEIEAYFHTVRENPYLSYVPVAKTAKTSVWLLFPRSRPYEKYSLTRHLTADLSTKTLLETDFTADHPYGHVIGWTVLNPEIGYTYTCQWEWKK